MNYGFFNKTPDHALNICNALEYLKANNINSLEFDKGVYEIYPDMASEGVYCTSNHGFNGYKRIAFLIKDMKNLTVDGGGSEFIFNGIINPFIVDGSGNITIKNLKVFTPKVFTATAEIISINGDSFDIKLPDDSDYYIDGSKLYFGTPLIWNFPLAYIIEVNNDKLHLEEKTADYFLNNDDTAAELEKGIVRLKFPRRQMPKPGNKIILCCRARNAPAFMLQKSSNILIEDVTVYSALGMGVLAQKCENIHINRFKTECKKDRYVSLNADATHFVHCKGYVKVTNSSFMGQLDDALNVHGVYTKIISKDKNSVTVKYMHHQAKGLDIYEKGSKINITDPVSLIVKDSFTVKDVKVINIDTTVLILDKSTENITVGDDAEDITYSPEVIFDNNRVFYNRARGILLGARGKTVISNNYFNSAGAAILFESNGNFWYESGAVLDVEIKNNTFDNCRYCNWCNGVIEVCPKGKYEDGKYFHGKISVTDNVFKDTNYPLFIADNSENIIFKNNKTENCTAEKLITVNHCKNVESDI